MFYRSKSFGTKLDKSLYLTNNKRDSPPFSQLRYEIFEGFT